MNRVLLLIIGLITLAEVLAQDVPVFGWQSHFSYRSIQAVEPGNQGLYACTDKALYFFDSEDNSINLLNKITGLSDIGIGDISFNSANNVLAIGYQNGNLDIIENGFIKNITTILEAPNIEEKAFNQLQIINEELWGGLEFGMIRYDLNQSEFAESYQNIGANGERVAINDFIITQDSILAASDDGILSVSLDDQTNRQDFNFWKRQLVGLPFHQIESFGSSIYASIENDLFKRVNGNWQFLTSFPTLIMSIDQGNSGLFVITESELFELVSDNPQPILSAKSEWGSFNSFRQTDSEFVLGTTRQGLLIFQDLTSEPVNILPAGPFSDLSSANVDSLGIQFWVTLDHLSTYQATNAIWDQHPIEKPNGGSVTTITDIALNYTDRIVSSYTQGPFISSENGYLSLNEEVSPNNPLVEENGSLNLSAIVYSEGQLWMVQKEVDQALSTWNPTTDEWQIYGLSHPLRNYINDLFIADNQDKWLPIDLNRGGGVLVFNEVENVTRYLNTNGGQGGLPGRKITDIQQDQDRFIWITTNEGICFFPNPSLILSGGSLTANVPIFDGGLLLRDEYLTAIAIDPANRKWIATKDNGVWLFSETGEELVQHFTTKNSPLPSNEVSNVSIDPKSGQVFFTTPNGIASFRSDATEGSATHENVRIYPNPVEPNFNGFVVIEGLVNNAFLKLTDVSGKLVREIQANGSTATWNVRDLNGARVQTGVYLVFSSNRDGSETFVGKIVVI